MKLEKGIISNSQLLFMMMAFMQSMSLTADFSFPLTKQGTWIVVLIAFAITLPTVWMYLTIAKRYPGKNLIQINDEVFGVYLGKVISVLYIWFFFQLTIHYMYFFNSFWLTYIMPETPRYAFLIMFGLVSAFAVRKGLEVIARCCFLFTIMTWLTTFTLTTLLLGNMKLSYLLPVLDVPLKDFIQSTHIMVAVPFCDIVLFLMIFPYTADKQKLKKPVLIAISLSALQLVIVAFRDILTLGPQLSNSVSASFTAARQINLADILTRMDILVAIALLITIFIKITVFYYVTVLSAAQMLNLRSYKPLVIPIGALAVMIGGMLYPSDMEQAYAAKYAWPFNASIYEFLLPILTLVVITIRDLAGKKKEMEAS
ncbi:MAG: endospore germination permease [Intestinimonas sp.]|jgi:spore germination protein KB|nr:endospore germination permease [Intestinimonas sp.]